MAAAYTLVDYEAEEPTTSAKSDVERVELADLLGCENMGLRVWHLAPGDSMSYHSHSEQEEVYVPLGTDGQIRVEDEMVDVPAGSAIRVSPDRKRQMVNQGDAVQRWLVVGAPGVDGDSTQYDDPV